MLNAVVNNGFDVAINYWVVFLFNYCPWFEEILFWQNMYVSICYRWEGGFCPGDSVLSNLGGDCVRGGLCPGFTKRTHSLCVLSLTMQLTAVDQLLASLLYISVICYAFTQSWHFNATFLMFVRSRFYAGEANIDGYSFGGNRVKLHDIVCLRNLFTARRISNNRKVDCR